MFWNRCLGDQNVSNSSLKTLCLLCKWKQNLQNEEFSAVGNHYKRYSAKKYN